MAQAADVILIEQSTAGNPDKTHTGQVVDIQRAKPTTNVGVDGKLSVGRHPSVVKWFGGKVSDLTQITHVRIVDPKGTILIEGELCNTYNAPFSIPGGVQFELL